MSKRNIARMVMLSHNSDTMDMRRRDSKGRYARSDYDTDMYHESYPMEGRYYGGDRRMARPMDNYMDNRIKRYDIEYDDGLEELRPSQTYPMYQTYNRPIGFRDNEYRDDYRSDITYPMRSEMEHRTSGKQSGYAEGRTDKLDKQMADEWVRNMKNSDGSIGPHWSIEQTTQVMRQYNIDCDPNEFYAIMNAIYSDYGKTLTKYGLNKVDVYVDLAKDWLKDNDAVPNKAAAYFEYIVK